MENGLFLQSYAQRDVFESMGQKTWLFEYGVGKSKISSLVTKVEARRGVFLFLPYGPMMNGPESQEFLDGFFQELIQLAKHERASFIRVSPYWEENKDIQKLLEDIGFHKAPLHILAETLWILDLSGKSEEELFIGMNKKHRNLVRRAVKDGVEIRISNSRESVERFLDLHWQTVSRHQFTPYPKEYFREQVRCFSRDDQVAILEAYYEEELLASAIIMYYGESSAYHHGASSSQAKHRKIPASYLLQWEAIKEALRRGATTYNFWGIAPYTLSENGKREYSNPNHPFRGITHFKTGFGGYRRDLISCHDLVVGQKYYLNWVVEKLRKWRRGF